MTKQANTKKMTRNDCRIGRRVHVRNFVRDEGCESIAQYKGTVIGTRKLGCVLYVTVEWEDGCVFSIRPRDCRVYVNYVYELRIWIINELGETHEGIEHQYLLPAESGVDDSCHDAVAEYEARKHMERLAEGQEYQVEYDARFVG